MALKVLLRFSDKPTISKVFQIASISHSKDDLSILRPTEIDPVGRGARLTVEGGNFSVTKDSKGDLNLSFSAQMGNDIICSVPNRVLVVGDLKFFAQMLGRENMSRSWCMWCQSHPSEWKSLSRSFPPWTIELLKRHKDKIVSEKLKESKEISELLIIPFGTSLNLLTTFFQNYMLK
jgi:hypothetical protein